MKWSALSQQMPTGLTRGRAIVEPAMGHRIDRKEAHRLTDKRRSDSRRKRRELSPTRPPDSPHKRRALIQQMPAGFIEEMAIVEPSKADPKL